MRYVFIAVIACLLFIVGAELIRIMLDLLLIMTMLLIALLALRRRR